MKRIIILFLLLPPLFCGAQSGILFMNPPGQTAPPFAIVPAIDTTVIDDGYAGSPTYGLLPTNYNKWPRPVALSDGSIVSIYVKSHQHGVKGWAAMSRSTDGGHHWTNRIITVGGVNAKTAEISAGMIDGRIFVGLQSDDTATEVNGYLDYARIKMVYIDEAVLCADFSGCTFTSGGETVFNTTGWPAQYSRLGSPFGRPQKVGNEIWQPFYQTNLYNGVEYESQTSYLKSTNNGVSWDTATVPILVQRGAPYPNGFTSEIGIITLPGYGIVCLLRNEQYGYFTHVRSADSGAHWQKDTLQLFYAFDANAEELRPVHPILYHDSVYVFCGNRGLINGGFPDYALEYITCTPAVLWNNRGYTGTDDFHPSVQRVNYVVNAITNSSGLAWGYTEPIIRYYPSAGIDELLVHGYDSSPLNAQTDEVRTIIFQKVIKSLNTYPLPL